MNRRQVLLLVASQAGILWLGVSGFASEKKMDGKMMMPGEIKLYSAEKGDFIMSEKVIKSEAEWKQLLSSEQYHVLREEGT
ncbi:MAG: hypothetical protein OQK50_07260, partial [Deltaproteobacteria bacterium]|nr:hypothetical protein [Deltaproteobacteria bacterium]